MNLHSSLLDNAVLNNNFCMSISMVSSLFELDSSKMCELLDLLRHTYMKIIVKTEKPTTNIIPMH